MSDCKFRKGGKKKYILTQSFMEKLKVKPKKDIFLPYVTYLKSGLMYIPAGYGWDGPSGPAIDTDNFMDGSLIHDMLYQLMREGHLPRTPYRLWADNEMFRQCKKDNMSLARRCWTWLGVRLGGYAAAGGKFTLYERSKGREENA
jgi:hypothetical protein